MLNSISEEEFKSKLIALAYACPLEQESPNCPLKKVREKNFSDKIKWVNSLSLPTKKTIYKYHLLCISKNKKKQEVVPVSRS
ncbi:MAG: hypothetical protein WGN25_18175 [Candidatus Electrothrix sp. GW3-4]|uniref:hypothetical protein n=1 Tax=Candidatus Electrothrix sp. GW3-4 TaxID=3126740 RepID=UPI0030CAF18F